MKKILIIEGDVNDADYVTSEHEIKSKEFEDRVKKIIAVIKKANPKAKYGVSWENSEYADEGENPSEKYKGLLSEDDIEFMNELVPSGENGIGIHTIESVRIIEIANEEKLL